VARIDDGDCSFCGGTGIHPFPPWCLLQWPCPVCRGRKPAEEITWDRDDGSEDDEIA
jgi:hypothetical protein